MFSTVSSESHSDWGHLFTNAAAMKVVEACPDLREISIRDEIGSIHIPAVSPYFPGTPRLMRLSSLSRLIPNRLNTYEHRSISLSWISNLTPPRFTWMKLQ